MLFCISCIKARASLSRFTSFTYSDKSCIASRACCR